MYTVWSLFVKDLVCISVIICILWQNMAKTTVKCVKYLIPHILFLSDLITANVSVTPLNPIHGNECGKFILNKDDEIYNLQRNFLSKLCHEYVRNFSVKTKVKYIRFCGGLDMMHIIILF
jgi:hypothetical protein